MTRPAFILSENGPLASLAPTDFAIVHRHIERELLAPQSVLYDPGAPISKVYFPHGGAISLVIGMRAGQMIEVGMTGRDGIVGAFAALGDRRPCHGAVV